MPLFSIIRVAVVAWLIFAGAAWADEPVPRNIGVYGDSLGDGVWSGLYAVLKPHPENKLFRHAKVGAGLTRPDYADWFKEFTASLDDEHITNAVVMFGTNDQQGIRDENRKRYTFPTDTWKQAYADRVDAVMAELNKRKINTIWVGLPILRKDELNTGAAILNQIFADEAKKSGITFLPLIDSFKNSDGAFADHLPDASGHLRQVRVDDGIHFTNYGYELIATKVYSGIATPNLPEEAHAGTP